MAKVPKVKKRDVSVHSRAARRGASPPITLAVSKDTPDDDSYKPWLHNAQNAGIAKKKRVEQLSRQQKLRRQRGIEKAEIDLDRLEKKVSDSQQRGKAVKARRVDWDELNEHLADEVKKPTKQKFKPGRFDALKDDEEQIDVSAEELENVNSVHHEEADEVL